MAAPAAIRTALIMGDTFSSCLVSMPIDAPPTLTPERSLCGMGTTSEAIPRTTNTTPIQNNPRMVFSFGKLEVRTGSRKTTLDDLADSSYSQLDAVKAGKAVNQANASRKRQQAKRRPLSKSP